MEFLQDYKYTLHYHPGNANVVVDALSRKPRGVLSCLFTAGWKMQSDLEEVEWTLEESQEVFVGNLTARPRLFARVIELQQKDPESQELRVELP